MLCSPNCFSAESRRNQEKAAVLHSRSALPAFHDRTQKNSLFKANVLSADNIHSKA